VTFQDLRLKLDVSLHRTRLDRALAEGADPRSDAALALRARQLTSTTTLRAIAGTIENLIDAAEESPSSWTNGDPRPPLQRHDLLAARDDLRALAEALRDREVDPQAAALAATLVWDSASPAYAQSETSVGEWTKAVRSTAHLPGAKRSSIAREMGRAGLEPATSGLSSRRSPS
jgi:hypothetical protein